MRERGLEEATAREVGQKKSGLWNRNNAENNQAKEYLIYEHRIDQGSAKGIVENVLK